MALQQHLKKKRKEKKSDWEKWRLFFESAFYSEFGFCFSLQKETRLKVRPDRVQGT